MVDLTGFEPVYNGESKVLILGSFPSVKSRELGFYYGNKRNRFWSVLSEFFGCEIRDSIEDKKNFVLENKVALWDIVTSCEIVGSRDDTIKNFTVANIERLLQNSKICLIILNGGKAYEIFIKNYPSLNVPFIKLPSTSPANVSFKKEEWLNALQRVFNRA